LRSGPAPKRTQLKCSATAYHYSTEIPAPLKRCILLTMPCMRQLALLVMLSAVPVQAEDDADLDFLANIGEFHDLRKMLPAHLMDQANRRLEERSALVSGMSTLEAVAVRRGLVRATIAEAVGGFPERTPLNPRITGAIDRGDYRIEKIVFESQSRFFVTANLYLPKTGSPPYPAILYPLGHEPGGKSNATWQQMLGSLARRGYVAFAWDPLGQEERKQFFDPDWNDSKFFSSTVEHTELDGQCMLIGDAIARYTIWDGIRALDYLLSRPEVDPSRVGAAGNSGGGTHTTYLAALDDRIKVAAPSCYITSWRKLLEVLGPQDGEQVFPGWLKNGMDFSDFIYSFAPKPFLVLSAIRDFFPIGGARESFAEAHRVYEALGSGDKLQKVEADDGHGYTKPRRQAAYRWFARWLKSQADDGAEQDVPIARSEELWATPTGQVATSLQGEDVFSLNLKRYDAAKLNRPALSLEKVRELAVFNPGKGDLNIRTYGTASRSGYRMEKLTYESEPGIMIPALLYVPETGTGKYPAVLYADGEGKKASAEDAERLVHKGFIVMTVDLRGMGETRPALDSHGDFTRYFGDHDSAETAILLGKTLAGMRAADISRAVDLLAARPDVDISKLSGFGKGAAAVAMLHAAALDPRFQKLALEDMLMSYDAIVTHRIHRKMFEQIVPSALKYYDLPDLAGSLAPRPVWIIDAVNQVGQVVPTAQVRSIYHGQQIHIEHRSESPDFAF
jgi:cephalosporin-C deacetylase-like acetyl esterase